MEAVDADYVLAIVRKGYGQVPDSKFLRHYVPIVIPFVVAPYDCIFLVFFEGLITFPAYDEVGSDDPQGRRGPVCGGIVHGPASGADGSFYDNLGKGVEPAGFQGVIRPGRGFMEGVYEIIAGGKQYGSAGSDGVYGFLDGFLVVFSAAQGDETAYPNREQQHGLFTYYLLKKLQETEGNVELKALGDYVTKQVSQQSLLLNSKKQTPSVVPSASLGNEWQTWKLKQ